MISKAILSSCKMRQDKKWPKQRNFTKFKAESSADWGVMPGDWQALVEPQVRQFLDYWESRRRGRSRMPGRPNLDPADIPGLLPGVFLVDVLLSGSGLRFRYRLLGTEPDGTSRIWLNSNSRLEPMRLVPRSYF